MLRYLIEHIPTPQTAAAVIKNPEDRTAAVRAAFESVGGTLDHYYMALDENTVYLLGEVPDRESLSAIVGSIWASGVSMSLKAKVVNTAAEAVGVFKKAATVSYQRPGK